MATKKQVAIEQASADIITAESVQQIGERIAIKAVKTVLSRSAGGKNTKAANGNNGAYIFINQIYTNLITDINNMPRKYEGKKCVNINYIASDSYDIAQTAINFLCGYIGKRLTDSAANGQTDKNGAPVDIKRACFRAVNRYIMQQRTKQYKTVVLQDNSGAYITPPPLWDMPTLHDIQTVKKAIAAMKLSNMERRILSMRMQGISINKITNKLRIARQSVQVYLKRIAAKAAKIGIQPQAAAAKA